LIAAIANSTLPFITPSTTPLQALESEYGRAQGAAMAQAEKMSANLMGEAFFECLKDRASIA
jgi:hypothetical protein